MPALTGPQSEAVQRRSQGGPVHTFSLLGLRDSSHRGASTEQRTSRFMVPGVPHRAEHCKGHTESAPGLSGTEQGWGSSCVASRFPPAALAGLQQAHKKVCPPPFCCSFTLGPRAPTHQCADA